MKPNRKTRKKQALALKNFFGMQRPPNARHENIESLNRQAMYQLLIVAANKTSFSQI